MLEQYRYKGKHRAKSYGKAAAMAAAIAATMAVAATPANAHEGGPDWGPIIKCESGGNPKAQNPTSTASGLYQFINGTWAAYGGRQFAPTAAQATVAEQTIVANRAYAREGYGPWAASKSCWAGKVGKGTAPVIKEPAKADRKPSPKPRPKPAGVPTHGGDGTYVVKSGDTLSEIAQDHGTTWRSLFDKNRDVVEQPDLIFPGEKLDI